MHNKNFIFFLIFILVTSCSFDNKTGIWGESKKEKKRIAKLQKQQKDSKNTYQIFSSENIFSQEKNLNIKINLSEPKNNSSWKMYGLNHQNFLGNIYLPGINNNFLKKKIGKNKFSVKNITNSPLIYKNNIYFSDDTGSIFSIDQSGKINWKKNIYKKIYKKIYKNLSIGIYENKIYVADNIGLIYAIDLINGQLLWIKNHGVPLKSKIKIFNNQIFLINQDNRLISINTKDGSAIWDIRSISSFIKSQNFLSLALSKKGNVISSNSAGDLIKVNSVNGDILWHTNTLKTMLTDAADFFKSSDIVINDSSIIFSTKTSIFSFNLNNGYINWEKDVSSVATPIIDEENIFIITENGYFVIMDLNTGTINSSTNILKVLKKKQRLTKIAGFILASGKIYAVTENGYLIICSASLGKVENFKKIGKSITSSPIVSNGKLFIYTEDSKILGYN